MRNTLTDKQIIKLAAEYDKLKIQCKCGKKVVVPVYKDKMLCSWCKHYVYRNKKLQFQEQIKKRIKGE